MSGIEEEPTSMFLKKDGWVRYVVWALAIIVVGLGAFAVVKITNQTSSTAIPNGYRFAVIDNSAEASDSNVTYYVYDDKIITNTKTYSDEGAIVSSKTIVYDSVDTSSITYDQEDSTSICPVTDCKTKKKPLSAIKKALAGKAGREFVGR